MMLCNAESISKVYSVAYSGFLSSKKFKLSCCLYIILPFKEGFRFVEEKQTRYIFNPHNFILIRKSEECEANVNHTK